MNEVIRSRDPEAIVADLKRWNPPPGSRSQLIINENFIIEFVEPMPGRWHRFWYRLLLGWRWEKV